MIIANALWVNERDGYSVSGKYSRMFAKAMNGQARSVGFDGLAGEISDWARESTDGFLSPSVSVSPDDQMLLTNLLYYKGHWHDPFWDKNTRPDVFHAPDGDVEVEFMHDGDTGSIYEGDGFICAARYLGNSRMMFFLPDEGVDVGSLVDSPEKVAKLLAASPDERAVISWSVPKFDIASNLGDLAGCVKELGARGMFEPSAMFEKMIEGPDADATCISQISQELRVKIDEKGCEAAALSVSMLACLGASFVEKRVDFNLNRPFIFALTSSNGSERGGGIPLFMGIVRDPSKS